MSLSDWETRQMLPCANPAPAGECAASSLAMVHSTEQLEGYQNDTLVMAHVAEDP